MLWILVDWIVWWNVDLIFAVLIVIFVLFGNNFWIFLIGFIFLVLKMCVVFILVVLLSWLLNRLIIIILDVFAVFVFKIVNSLIGFVL